MIEVHKVSSLDFIENIGLILAIVAIGFSSLINSEPQSG